MDLVTPTGKYWEGIIRDTQVLDDYWTRPDAVAFTGYPKTGNNRLSMILEYVLRRGQLPRTYFRRNMGKSDWYACWEHDEHARQRHAKVIYVYRDPVDALGSYYTRLDNLTTNVVLARARQYAYHLQRYLLSPSPGVTVVPVAYEDLGTQKTLLRAVLPVLSLVQQDDPGTIGRLCRVLDRLTLSRCRRILNRVATNFVRSDQDRRHTHQRFRDQYGDMIYSTVHSFHPELQHLVPRRHSAIL